MDSKFIKPEKNELMNEIDFINFYYPFKDIFKDDKHVHLKSDTEACYMDSTNLDDDINKPTFIVTDKGVKVDKPNPFNISAGSIISKFMLLTAIKFKGDSRAAQSYVSFNIIKNEIPYIQVGCDYYKLILKDNRYGGTDKVLKSWKKDTITEHHTKHLLKRIPAFDDFCILPDNKKHSPSYKNCYNLYAPFAHKPSEGQVTEADIPNSFMLLNHIFGDQIELGLKYIKLLYEHPKQILPILVLVSKEKGTGKTTFLNWLYMIFGQNVTTVSPEILDSQFNASYAKKNILLFEEMFAEKSTAYQKVMSLSTGKMINFRDLFSSGTDIPFFGKLIMCTNKVKDFMRIDSEENRFWIRYINPVKGEKHIKIEDDLFSEIPKLLKYLTQLPEIDFSKDRLVFTLDEIRTEHLDNVKNESKSGLHKELEILIEDFFSNNNDADSFFATAKDIKREWFDRDTKISRSYILRVLREEMKVKAATRPMRYYPFAVTDFGKEIIGRPFRFPRNIEKFDTFEL